MFRVSDCKDARSNTILPAATRRRDTCTRKIIKFYIPWRMEDRKNRHVDLAS